MQNIEYTYKPINEIINSTILVKDFSFIQFIALSLLIFFIFIVIKYIIPISYILRKYLEEEKKSKNKKNTLKRIILQKELEDSILKEVETDKQSENKKNTND